MHGRLITRSDNNKGACTMLPYLAFHRKSNTDESFHSERDNQPDGSITGRVDQRFSKRLPVSDEPRH